jgi:hypothetical protein
MEFTNKLKRHIYLTTFLLLILVFLAGVLFGRNLETGNSQRIADFMKDNELNTESYLTEQELINDFGEDNCPLAKIRIDDLSVELGEIGRQLTIEGAKEKLGEDNFNFLKRKFHLMQIRTYVLFKKLIDECNISSNVILYYYSINDENSTEQGHVLDKIVTEYDAKVFAIEYNYSKELGFLESYYNIKKTPSLVINYNYIHEGLTDYETVSKEMAIPDGSKQEELNG